MNPLQAVIVKILLKFGVSKTLAIAIMFLL